VLTFVLEMKRLPLRNSDLKLGQRNRLSGMPKKPGSHLLKVLVGDLELAGTPKCHSFLLEGLVKSE
jgi:hypothetical protein